MDESYATAALTQWVHAWRHTRGLTYDLLRALPYAVMNFSPHPEFGTLIRQIRHAADIQFCYLTALQTRVMDFSIQPRDRSLERSKEALDAALTQLDEQLYEALRTLSADALGEPIRWDDANVSLMEHLLRLLQHETLHHGMWVFYAKIADLPLPESWARAWALR